LADEAAARKERELQSEVASLRKRLDEQSAHAARESVRASDLAAQLDAARVAEEVRAFSFVRARTHVFFLPSSPFALRTLTAILCHSRNHLHTLGAT
jgi:hypothetical protein